MRSSLSTLMKNLALKALNLLLPHQCPLCLKTVEHQGICPPCWCELKFITAPFCACCGYPFGFESSGHATLCGACLQEKPPFDRAVSILTYTTESKKLLFAFKHGRRLILAPLFSRWLLTFGNRLFKDIDMVIPVPLHWSRLMKRRFNQSAVLARAVATTKQLSFQPTLLKRVRATPSQGRMTPAGRADNVRGAFALSPSDQAAIRGKKILLVDDVYTTGATVKACAKALRQAGAKEINVLTLMRVVREA